jgi:hypothetical protein
MPPPYDTARDSLTALNPVLGHGALNRPRSGSDGTNVDRQRERQLVGSLTNSYKFKSNGLIKKVRTILAYRYQTAVTDLRRQCR